MGFSEPRAVPGWAKRKPRPAERTGTVGLPNEPVPSDCRTNRYRRTAERTGAIGLPSEPMPSDSRARSVAREVAGGTVPATR